VPRPKGDDWYEKNPNRIDWRGSRLTPQRWNDKYKNYIEPPLGEIVYRPERAGVMIHDSAKLDDAINIINRLPERMKEVIALRYCRENDEELLAFREVGKRIGLSTERVRQILAKALRIILYATEGYHFKCLA